MRLRYCTACCEYVHHVTDCTASDCPNVPDEDELYEIAEPDDDPQAVDFSEQEREYEKDYLTDDSLGHYVDEDGMHVERFDDE